MEQQQQAVSHQQTPTTDAPPAANPTFTPHVPTPTHPSYAEMITAAITWDRSQGKEGGSSKRAIGKYIDRVYTNLPPTHSALLSHHLKRLKSTGQLVMVKNSYQLSSSPAPPLTGSAPPQQPQPVQEYFQPHPLPVSTAMSTNPTPKRRPGRPPKPKPEAQPVLDNGPPPTVAQPVARKRGRPARQQPQQQQQQQQEQHQIIMEPAHEVPFVQVQPISQAQPNPVNGQAQPQVVPKRKPGRPPKRIQTQPPPVVPFAAPEGEGAVNGAMVVVKRGRGRPPKFGTGGPKKAPAPVVTGTGRPRGRPKGYRKSNVVKGGGAGGVLGPVSRVGKRGRGRPPKIVGGGVTIPGRGRGRPPKGSGVVSGGGVTGGPMRKQRRLSGKPLGRPRKDAASLTKHTPEQRMVNDELTRKLELIQSKVRDVVGVIRPYVANETAALIALEQLEELVTPNEIAPPTAPPMTATPMSVIAPPGASVPANLAAAPSINAPPTVTVTAPVMNAPAPFSVTLPPMTLTAPFHAPPGVESQPMSWNPSTGAQS